MADEADIANDYAEAMVANALANRPKPTEGAVRTFCIDCDELIPHQRREFGAERCVYCQTLAEAN